MKKVVPKRGLSSLQQKRKEKKRRDLGKKRQLAFIEEKIFGGEGTMENFVKEIPRTAGFRTQRKKGTRKKTCIQEGPREECISTRQEKKSESREKIPLLQEKKRQSGEDYLVLARLVGKVTVQRKGEKGDLLKEGFVCSVRSRLREKRKKKKML